MLSLSCAEMKCMKRAALFFDHNFCSLCKRSKPDSPEAVIEICLPNSCSERESADCNVQFFGQGHHYAEKNNRQQVKGRRVRRR